MSSDEKLDEKSAHHFNNISEEFLQNNYLTNRSNYLIAVCQGGKFAATFDTVNLRVRVLENTDHRPFTKGKTTQQDSDWLEIDKTIAYFKINDDLDYEADCNPFLLKEIDLDHLGTGLMTEDKSDTHSSHQSNLSDLVITEVEDKWSLCISNIQKIQKGKNFDNEYYIYVAMSHININEHMKGKNNNDPINVVNKKKLDKKLYTKKESKDTIVDMPSLEHKETKKGTVIYCLKLKKSQQDYVLDDVNYYYFCGISGICRFVEEMDSHESDDYTLKRFIIANFYGMYNFKYKKDFRLNKKYDYPTSIRRELNYWYKEDDCMNRLLSCIYDKYFTVRQYKNSVQLLEVYDMANMELDTTAKRVERTNKHTRNYTFSISRLQLCFTQGLNSIGLYFMENGLEITTKDFSEIEEIYSIEFIDSDKKLLIIGKSSESRKGELKLVIWDLYKTGKVNSMTLNEFPSIKDLGTRLARTSGNILQVNNKGKVMSVIQQIEKELCQQESDNILKEYTNKKRGRNSIGVLDQSHILHIDKNINPNFRAIIVEVEPWLVDNYEKNSYCLYEDKKETLQLIVGRSTVQIWHQIHSDNNKRKEDLPNDGEPFLEYIWSNSIPEDQESEETRLQVKNFKYKSGSDKLSDFRLTIHWLEINPEINNQMIMKEKTIQSKDIHEKCRALRHACKALEHLNRRKKYLANNYIKVYQYEKMLTYAKHIVWRFAQCKSDQFIMLDIRHNLMKNLILADCDYLIKMILFGAGCNKENKTEEQQIEVRHIPRSKLWPGKKFIKDNELDLKLIDDEGTKPENDMELAIFHCRERELKDTIIIAYLLEYYCKHATDYAGWMSTVSKAVPLIFKYNYDDYARKLFRKECFADQDHFSAQDPLEIIPKKFLVRRNHNIKFRAFRPLTKLSSDKYKYKWSIKYIWSSLEHLLFKISQYSEDFDNNLGKSPLSLRVVPLPKFTMNKIKKEKSNFNFIRIFINFLWFILIPQWFRVSDRNKLSPFSNMIRFENNDDIYDNPATEAIIDFFWHKARNFNFFTFLRFVLFSICYVYVCWEYIGHEFSSGGSLNTLIAFICLYYYLAIYLSVIEVLKLYYRGPRKYFGEMFINFDLSNLINITNIVLPTITMNAVMKHFQLSDGFGSVEASDDGLIVMVSFSIFFLWMGLIFHLRLISYFAIYIYYVMIIFKSVLPFILFMAIVIVAFAHTMFVLFRAKIPTKDDNYSGFAIAPSNDTISIAVQNDYNTTDPSDNPFSAFYSSILAAYFWISDDWVQRDHFNFWANDLITVIASIYLVIVLQNMLIAFMSGVYEDAERKGRQALLRFRANHIAEYEALHHIHFWKSEPESKYIYYIGQSQNFEEWYKSRKIDQGEIYKDFEEKYTFTSHIFSESNFKTGYYDEASIWKYEKDLDDLKNENDSTKNQ